MESRKEEKKKNKKSYNMGLVDDIPTNTLTFRLNSSGLILFCVISQENIHKSQSLNPNTDTLFVCVPFIVLRVHLCVLSATSHCLK